MPRKALVPLFLTNKGGLGASKPTEFSTLVYTSTTPAYVSLEAHTESLNEESIF